MFHTLILVSLLASSPGSPFVGRWRNQAGSEMEIAVDVKGHVNGRYRTTKGAPKPDEWFDLNGSVNGNVISFSVSWGENKSITTWMGHLLRGPTGQAQMQTLWLLGSDASNDDAWKSILTGSATFEHQSNSMK